MSVVDIITIVLLTAGILIAGMAFSKKGKNMTSFFAAGGAVPWQMSSLSLFMGFFSAGTFVVWGSVAYLYGWVSISIQWTMALAGLIVGTFIAPRWHRTGALTVAEYINKRLGVPTQKGYTFMFLFISLFLTASFLYPVAKIAEVSTGLDLNLCIILLGVFCILYVSAGGLWAVVSTDILQFVILVAAVIIVVPLSFDRVGGFSGFLSAIPGDFFDLTNAEYTFVFIIAFGIYNMIFLGGNWAYVQRFTCVKSENDAKKVGWGFAALYFVSPILWMLPPMIYHVLDPSLDLMESEGAYLLICKEVLPKGILGLMIGGMIFATTSAMNSKLNIASGVITNDIFKRLRPNSSDKTLMLVARLSTILFGVISILIALLIPSMGGVVNVVISLAALTGVPLYLPIIWTLFSKRQTGFSVLTATILSLALNGIFKFLTPVAYGFSLNRTEEMVLGVLLPAMILLAFEIYYVLKGRTSERYQAYMAWEHANRLQAACLTSDEEKAVKRENSYSQRIVGYGMAIIGVAIAVLGLMAPAYKLFVASTGGLFALCGFYIVLSASRKIKVSRRND
ncbi:sodium:solute symporter family protein [Hallella bergensis]|uniref:sodium:solute symporter family protein n=1 Tax=Hallella bergensis TaxID=242750 RepID=UPI0023F26CE0|nr:sodium:solute symporter family protein [Hallella bergensis]